MSNVRYTWLCMERNINWTKVICIANVSLHIALDALLDKGQPLDGRLLFAVNSLGGLNSIKVPPFTVTHCVNAMYHEFFSIFDNVRVNFFYGSMLRKYIWPVK